MLSIIFVTECGCRLTSDGIITKSYKKNGVDKCHRICKEHGGRILYKIATCDNCKNEIRIDKLNCNRKKCPGCGNVLSIKNKKQSPKKIKQKAIKIDKKFCIFCGRYLNVDIKGKCGMCNFCKKEFLQDEIDLEIYSSFIPDKNIGLIA